MSVAVKYYEIYEKDYHSSGRPIYRLRHITESKQIAEAYCKEHPGCIYEEIEQNICDGETAEGPVITCCKED